MINIRALKPHEWRQAVSLLAKMPNSQSCWQSLDLSLSKFPIWNIVYSTFSQFLPLSCQKCPLFLVATCSQKIVALSLLSADERQGNRWKIHALISTEEEEAAFQLLTGIIQEYGDRGVQTFLAEVDAFDNVTLRLLKQAGFRHYSRLYYFSQSATGQLMPTNTLPPIPVKGLRLSHNGDTASLAELYNDALPPDVRLYLAKQAPDFSRSLFQRGVEKVKGLFFKRWVVHDKDRNRLVAALEMRTTNYQIFYLKLTVNPGWDDLYRQMLLWAAQQAMNITTRCQLHIEGFEFKPEHLAIIKELGFQQEGVTEAFVKDYWIPIEKKEKLQHAGLPLFSDKPSPATQSHHCP